MSNGFGIETPAAKIATARSVFAMALRLNSEAIAGRIRRTIFERTVQVVTGGTGLQLPPYLKGTREDLLYGIFNLVLISLSASALTLDETLTEVFGPLSADTDTNRHNLRVMVHQIRNAFAHNPIRPKWIVFDKYRCEYPISLDDGTAFCFDARALDGDGIKPDQVGGLEFWVKLLQHCERLVA
jgi:hypothetical protein